MDNEAFRLIMLEGPQPDKVFILSQELIAFGRDTLNDLVVNDPEVSRQHGRLRYQDGVYTIEDLGSTNGTFVNGVRITGPHTLADGDKVGLGETITLTYKASAAAATETIVAPSSDEFAPLPAVPDAETPFEAGLPPEPEPLPTPFETADPEPEVSTTPPPFPDDSLADEPIAPPPPFDAAPPMEPEPAAPPLPFEAKPAAPPPPFDAGFSESAEPTFEPEPDAAPPPPPVRPPTTAPPVGPPSVATAEKPTSRRNLLIGCGCLLLIVICAFVSGLGYLLYNAPAESFDDPLGNFGSLFGSIILPLSYLI